MNIRKIIEEHRDALRTAQEQARAKEAETAAAQETQARIVRSLMKEKVHALLEGAATQLGECGVESHVTHSAEERAGDTLTAWIVSTVSLVMDREKPAIAQLQFIGTASPENWHISTVAILPGDSAFGQLIAGDHAEQFTGTPAGLEKFVTRHLEHFVRSVFPS